jgi:hypothetical protein
MLFTEADKEAGKRPGEELEPWYLEPQSEFGAFSYVKEMA